MKTSHYPAAFVLQVLVLMATALHAQPYMIPNGSAQPLSRHRYVLTFRDSVHTAGSVWCSEPILLRYAFQADFTLYLGDNRSGGEGMAFLISASPDSVLALGASGSALGYGGRGKTPAISPSLAVEIDTRNSWSEGIPDNNIDHLALIAHGQLRNPIVNYISASRRLINIKDGKPHQFRVTWQPSTRMLQIYVDGDLMLTREEDIIERYFDGSDRVWIGFTAATGAANATNRHEVEFENLIVAVDRDYTEYKTFESSVRIFPNPIRQEVLISTSFSEPQRITVRLLNLRGQEVYQQTQKNATYDGFQIDLSHLPSGIYYITVSSGRRTITRKIIHHSDRV